MTRVICLFCMLTGAACAVEFQTHHIGAFRGEACGAGDFNNDGKIDIVALPYLYLAPEFKPVKIAEVAGEVGEDGKGYRDDFMNLPLDVDGDGRLDVVTCSWFAKKIEWLRNTGTAAGPWTRTLIEEDGHFECGELWDIDGDGKALEILPSVVETVWYERARERSPQKPGGVPTGLVKHVICDRAMTWGNGCGDVNGDGRPDVVRPDAWFEAPEDPRRGEWKEHPIAIGSLEEGKAAHTPQIFVYDVNGDGWNDLITSNAHQYGIFWYEQINRNGEIEFKQHLIDKSWSQAHSLALADLDGDGDSDLIAGKRFMAHNGGDPGATEPLGVYWYELQRGPAPEWTKHPISLNESIGSALNIIAEDLDGDGDIDIIVTGKWGGPVWFENMAGREK